MSPVIGINTFVSPKSLSFHPKCARNNVETLLVSGEENMTLFEFQLLPMQGQINVLYEQGVYIGKRKAEKLTVLLLQLDSFYVEVFYRKYRFEITRLRCSASTAMLDPYLSQIHVEYVVT